MVEILAAFEVVWIIFKIAAICCGVYVGAILLEAFVGKKKGK